MLSDRAVGTNLDKPIITLNLVKTTKVVQHFNKQRPTVHLVKVIVLSDKANKKQIKCSNNLHYNHRLNLLLDRISNRPSEGFQWDQLIRLSLLPHLATSP